MFLCPCRARGRQFLQGAGAQLPSVLPLSLHASSSPGAAVFTAGGPRRAGTGRHRSSGRQHPHPVLPRHLRPPGAAAQQECLRPVWWVHGCFAFFFVVFFCVFLVEVRGVVGFPAIKAVHSHLTLCYITFLMQFVLVVFFMPIATPENPPQCVRSHTRPSR